MSSKYNPPGHQERRKTSSESAKARASGVNAESAGTSVNSSSLEERIRVTAYLMAEKRSFACGHQLDDWLAAEALECAAGDCARGARGGVAAESPGARE